MIDLDQSIRLHQAADHEPDPEIKASGVWAYFYVAGVLAAGLVGAYFIMEAIAGA